MLRLAQGTYTGDGSNPRNITVSPSFAIKLLIIKGDISGLGGTSVSFAGMGAKCRDLNNTDDTLRTTAILSMGTGTFQIGSSALVNFNGSIFGYLAIGGDDTEIYAGSYVGNATDNRAITAPNFQPEFVFILQDANGEAIARFGGIAGDNGLVMGGTGNTTGADRIQSLDATGFTIGTAAGVNSNGVTYYYVAIRSMSSQAKTGNYAGNSTDDRDITGLGFTPEAIIIKAPLKVGQWDGTDNTINARPFGASTWGTNRIQAFGSGSFQVGTDDTTNATGNTYYYYALKDLANVAYTITAAQASFAESGQATLFHYGRLMAAAYNAFVLTGKATLFSLGHGIIAAFGSFGLTGENAVLTSMRSMASAVANFVLTGENSILKRGYGILADFATYALTGENSILKSARTIAAAYASYVLTGENSLLTKAMRLVVATASFVLTGKAARLMYNGLVTFWRMTTRHSSTKTNATKHTSTYNNQNKSAGATYTEENKEG